MESITLSNFKNVVNGTLSFRNPKNNSRASVLGLYGQNGSGKTAVVQAISLLSHIIHGFQVPALFADYVNIDADFAELAFKFSVYNTDIGADFHAIYQF